MNERKYELMERYLRGETTVNDLIDRIVGLEGSDKSKPVDESYKIKEYLFDTRGQAQHVLKLLGDFAEKHNYVSVADYFELIGVTPKYSDHGYGWTPDSIKQASIRPWVRYAGGYHSKDRGYLVSFPPVEVI